MKVQTVANGSVCIVISPENSMEEEILKQLMKQTGNEITEIRAGVRVLQNQINTGILIGKIGDKAPSNTVSANDVEKTSTDSPDESQTEEL